MKNIRWRALAGLTMGYLAVFLKLNWLWGVLVLLWVVPDIRRGSTHLLENVDRGDNPVLFWLICLTWLLGGLLLIGFSLYRLWS